LGFLGVIIRFIVSKEGKLHDPKKIQAIMNMLVPHNLIHIQIFNGTTQFYKCFTKNFATIMLLITKLTRKIESLLWIEEC